MGAFGPGAAPPIVGQWRCINVNVPQSGFGLSDACVFGDPGVTTYQTQFGAGAGTIGPIPISISTFDVQFTGLTSGATYTWFGPAQCIAAVFSNGDANPLNFPAYTFKPYDIWVYEPGATEYGSFAFQSDVADSQFQINELVEIVILNP